MIDADFGKRLLKEFGSPLYIYDVAAIEARADELIGLLPKGSSIYYSLKANPLPGIVSTIRRKGCRAEITSSGELKAVRMAGFEPARLLYGGPGKSAHEIDEAINAGIRSFSSESWTDLVRLKEGAKKAGVTLEILLRINPAKAPHAKLAMTGVESQFGFEEDELLATRERFSALGPSIKIIGVHVYYGTQISPDALTITTASALETAERVSRQIGFSCRVVNAGGGFPWPYATCDSGPDLSGAKEAYKTLLSNNDFSRSVDLWFESGRFLSASSGRLLATVLDIKQSKGKKFVILDTGIHHLGGMSGLGRIPRPIIGVENLTETRGVQETYDIVGPLCSPLDSLARGLKCSALSIGDVIAIPNVGAYGLTASLGGFLSHPSPPEVLYKGSEVVDVFRLGWGHQKM